jgi:hypothetical protein
VYHHRWSSTTSSGYSFKPSNPLSQKLGGFSYKVITMYGKKPMKPAKKPMKPAKPGKYAPKK